MITVNVPKVQTQDKDINQLQTNIINAMQSLGLQIQTSLDSIKGIQKSNALGLNTWSGYHDGAYSWTLNSTTLTDFTNSTVGVFAENESNNFGVVTTASGALPGITFTPDSVGAMYDIDVTLVGLNTTSQENSGFQLWDGTKEISTGEFRPPISLTPFFTVPLVGQYKATSTTPKTLTIRGVVATASNLLINTNGLSTMKAIWWNIVQTK